MDKFYVYIIKNTINDKVYIGQTYKNLNKRFKEHKRVAKGGKIKYKSSFSAIHSAINLHKENNFYIELLEKFETKDKMNDGEIFYIEKYESFGKMGYNMNKGGLGISDKTIKKMSEARIGENNASSKLTNIQVLEIIDKYISEEITQQTLANQYGVDITAISLILNRKNWRHLKLSKSKENKLKKILSNSPRKAYKLKKSQVIEMINLFINEGKSYQELSEKYSITKEAVGKIFNRKTWKQIKLSKNKEYLLKECVRKNLHKPLVNLKVTRDQIIEIRLKFKNGEFSKKELMKKYKVNYKVIDHIVNYITYKNIK